MSIFASLEAPSDDEHVEGCAIYKEHADIPGVFDFSGDPCNCGQPDAPMVYAGSHILPSDSDPRGGWVDIALIPSHIARDGRDDKEEDGTPWPYLRFGCNEQSVILSRRNVKMIADSLNHWLGRVPESDVPVDL